MSRGLATGACLTIVAIAGAAYGQEAPEPLAVAYEAPDGCPTADAFLREITARTTRARAAQPSERARVMHVVVTKRGEEHTGRLWIEDASTSSSARSVSGKTCSEVVGALALIGALAVDPRASTLPIATERPSGGPAAASPAGGSPPGGSPAGGSPPAGSPPQASSPGASQPQASPPGPAAPTTEPARPAETPSPPPPPRARASPPSSRGAPRGRVEVGLQAEVAFVAGAVPSGRLFGDFSIGPRDGLFAPAFRVALARSLEIDQAAAVGGATLLWTAGAVDLCPIRVVLVRSLGLRPCAGGSFGVLEASGTGIAAAVSRVRPWASLSAQGRLVWEPLSWLDVELEAGVISPLYRESFFFAPGVAVYEAPAAAFLSRAGLGLRFP